MKRDNGSGRGSGARKAGRSGGSRFRIGLLSLGLLLGTLSLGTAPSLAVSGEWSVSGEDTCFELTNSTYLNVTLCSTEVVNVTLESVPSVVSFTIRAVGNATSTEIAMSGFVPDATYYRHQDGDLVEDFTTEDGNYSFSQDLSVPHHVYVAEESSTKIIRDEANGYQCHLIGTWDGATKTCTLTTNVNEQINLESSGITLDGAGHSISCPPCFSYGVYASSRTGLTVKNVVVNGPYYGIYLAYSSGSTVGNVTVNGPAVTGGTVFGIYLYSSPGSTVTGNTVSATRGPGIYLAYSSGSTVSGNSVAVPAPGQLGCTYAILLSYSGLSTVTGNTAEAIAPWYTCSGISVYDSPGVTISHNVAKAGGSVGSGGSYAVGIQLVRSGNAMISGNTVSAFADWGSAGISLDASGSTTVSGNTITYPTGDGLTIHNSGGSLITSNVISATNVGVGVYISPDTGVSDNVVSVIRYSGIVISAGSESAQVLGNTVWSYSSYPNTAGILIEYYPGIGYHAVDGNTVAVTPGWGPDYSGNSVYGILVQDRGRVANNTVTMGQGIGISLCACSSTYTNNSVTVTTGRGMGGGGISTGYDVIRQNTVSVAYGDGILLNGHYNVVSENKIAASWVGIRLSNFNGNAVRANDIRGAQYGILLGLWWPGAGSSNTIVDNVVSDGGIGIYIEGSMSYNVVMGNLIARNQEGLRFSGTLRYHQVYYNCFLHNVKQLVWSKTDYTGTVWSDQGNNPSQGTPWSSPWGNYWSDYRGYDDGSGGRPRGDGVGDTNLPHQTYDTYPLMTPSMANYGRVCVGNAPPAVTSLFASMVSEGQPTVFTAVATDPENDALTYSFDFDDDGTFDATGASNTATFPWGDDHGGTARVRVSDGDQYVEAVTSVKVGNTIPAVDVGDESAVEGQPLVVSYHATDPGSDDLTVTIDWGDASDPEVQYWQLGADPDAPESPDIAPRDVSGTFTHTLGDDATLAATLTVEDDDGGITTKLLTIHVVNGEPEITAQDIATAFEGDPVDFAATATDPGSDDLTFCWDTDDGHTECRTYPSDGTYPHAASDGGTHTWGDDATYDIVLTVTDDDGGTTVWTQPTLIQNVAPSLDLNLGAPSVTEGSPVDASGQFTDPGSDDVVLTWEWGMGPTESRTILNDGVAPDTPKSPWGTYPFGGSDAMSHTYADSGIFPLTLTACDDDGGCASRTVPVLVDNVAPSVEITGPAPGSVYAVGAPVLFTGGFTDPGTADTHRATWSVDGISFEGTVTEVDGTGTVAGTYTFTAAGVYRVTLVVVDDDGGGGTADTVGELTAFVVIYDPTAGFVTGGGWFDSPPGAYVPDPTLTGKATFGFVSKYQKGKSLPTGETEFQFKAGDLTFRSASYDWLVCSGPKCMFKGTGTVNGAGVYGFQLTAWDGDIPGGGGQDRIRMKIWNVLTGELVYDNQLGADDFADPTTVIGGGSIVIHKG